MKNLIFILITLIMSVVFKKIETIDKEELSGLSKRLKYT